MNTLNYGPKKITLNEVSNDGMINEVQRYVMPLTESSLNRIMKHGDNGMIIISACRSEVDSSDPELSLRDEFEKDAEFVGGLKSIDSDALYDFEHDWLKRRNARKDKELLQDIQEAGYSYTPVYGGYKGRDSVQSSYEPSYIVYNYYTDGHPGDFDDLKQFACQMCAKYGQESVYVQAPGEAPKYLDKDGNKTNRKSSKNFKFNRDQEEYFTTTSRDKTNPQQFTADIRFNECYISLRPACYTERMRRTKQGEYIL